MNIINHFMNNMKTVLVDRWKDWSGRSNRPEYWFFTLYASIIAFLAMGIDHLIGFQFFNWFDPFSESNNAGIFMAIWILATLPASLSVTVRRLHDRGHSGWWLIAFMIPVLNFIPLYWVIRAAKDTSEAKKYVNPYGKLPK
jgi:uncharacterized membrane protein YhaH (DUF805 family)